MAYVYDYDYGYPDSGSAFMVAGIFGVILVIAIAVSIALYVMRSMGLYTIAKRRGLQNPWLAWIPVGREWLIGSVSDQYRYLVQGQIKNKRKLLLGLAAVNAVLRIASVIVELSMVGDVMMSTMYSFSDSYMASSLMRPMLTLTSLGGLISVVSIVLLVFRSICMYDLYRSCDPNNATLYLVLGILLGITEPIFLLVIRNKDKGMPPRRDVPPTEAWES